MAKIKIVKVPNGEVILWVRQELVGLTLLIAGGNAQSSEYPVTLNEVIAELEEKGCASAIFWGLYKPTLATRQLVFKADDCEFIPETSCSKCSKET